MGCSVPECMSRVPERHLRAWEEWWAIDLWVPRRDDLYAAQTAFETVRKGVEKFPGKLRDFLYTKAEDEKPKVRTVEGASKIAKSVWAARLAMVNAPVPEGLIK